MAKKQTNELVKYEPVELAPALIESLDSAIDKAVEIDSITSHTMRMLAKANARKQLGMIFENPQIREIIFGMQNSVVGFLTDKDNGYDYNVVKECAIEALMMGCSLDGNEWNIIKKRCYITKDGMTHKLNNLIKCGLLKSFVFTPGIPQFNKDQTAIVKARIDWLEVGKEKGQTKELEFQVKSFGNTDADYVNGKGEKRAKKWLYELITGRAVPVGDITDTIDVRATVVQNSPVPEKKPSGKKESLKKKIAEANGEKSSPPQAEVDPNTEEVSPDADVSNVVEPFETDATVPPEAVIPNNSFSKWIEDMIRKEKAPVSEDKVIQVLRSKYKMGVTWNLDVFGINRPKEVEKIKADPKAFLNEVADS